MKTKWSFTPACGVQKQWEVCARMFTHNHVLKLGKNDSEQQPSIQKRKYDWQFV